VRVEAPAANGKVQAFARARALIKSERYDDDLWVADLELSRAALPGLRRAADTSGSVREL
jgi:hypothetical protein